MNSSTFNAEVTIDDSETSGSIDLLDRLGLVSRHIALLAAWIATCGSLFFSEVLGWVPCVLCWYQRILMYPLALLLAIGIVRRDRGLPNCRFCASASARRPASVVQLPRSKR